MLGLIESQSFLGTYRNKGYLCEKIRPDIFREIGNLVLQSGSSL